MKKSSEQKMNNFRLRQSNSFIVRSLLLFAFGWAILQLFAYFETVFIIFTFAAIAAALLNYPVCWLERFLPRSAAAVLVFLVSLLIITALFLAVPIAGVVISLLEIDELKGKA